MVTLLNYGQVVGSKQKVWSPSRDQRSSSEETKRWKGGPQTRIPYASKFASRLREKASPASLRCSTKRASTACAVRPMGRDRLAQGLISTRLEESGNGEVEAHRLGDSAENREGPSP